MKKIIFLIASIVAICAAGLTGCTNESNGSGTRSSEDKNFNIIQDQPDKDGGNNTEKEQIVPDFSYRPHDHHRNDGRDEQPLPEKDSFRRHRHDESNRALVDDSDDGEDEDKVKPPCCEPRKQHNRHGDQTIPQPKPMPRKPR